MDKGVTSSNRVLQENLGGSCSDEMLIKAMAVMRQCLYTGDSGLIPEELQKSGDFLEVLQYIRLTQKYIHSMAHGEINEPILLQGYTDGLLKELQNNLQRVVQKARRVTMGDFSSDPGNMGEISEAFDIMGKTLQKALSRLERQKADLTELSLNLQREVDTRIHMEESLRLEQIRLQKLASTDSLTGLANRRYFFQIALREIERVRRTSSNACLAMLDIDHFKTLNDSLGHSAGDKALCLIAQTISSVIRPYDLVGRYGGDEFIFLFPETTGSVARSILDRLRDAVEKARIEVGDGASCITVSIGLTEVDTAQDSNDAALDHAIARADEGLYKAKKNSRNHICVV